MKKCLVILLALVFVLSIAGTALAAPANPFVDVPAKHWAYDAVSKLAAAGIVDGYGDGTFRGDRTMTRYEMAQIVAKAMARSDKADAANKALIDKLAVEFAAELNKLGVRVTKLENKTNIGLNYETLIRYSGNDAKSVTGTSQFDWRQRIIFGGAVNDNVSYGARMEASQVFGGGSAGVVFNQAYFNVKDFLGGIDLLTIGKLSTSGITNGLLNGKDGNNDGFMITKKMGDVTLKGFVVDESANSEVKLVNLDYKPTSNLSMNVAYQQGNWNPNVRWQGPHNVTIGTYMITKSFDVGAQLKMGDWTLSGEYVSTKLPLDSRTDKAYALQITNGLTGYFYPVANLVNPQKSHSDAFALSYRKQEYHATPIMSGFGGSAPVYGNLLLVDYETKGYFFTYQNVIAKGVVWTAEYQDLKGIGLYSWAKDKVWNTSFQFFF